MLTSRFRATFMREPGCFRGYGHTVRAVVGFGGRLRRSRVFCGGLRRLQRLKIGVVSLRRALDQSNVGKDALK